MKHSKHLLGCGIALAAGIVLIGVFDLPFAILLLLVCPLMMIFMMRSMNHGGGNSKDEAEKSTVHDHEHSNR